MLLNIRLFLCELGIMKLPLKHEMTYGKLLRLHRRPLKYPNARKVGSDRVFIFEDNMIRINYENFRQKFYANKDENYVKQYYKSAMRVINYETLRACKYCGQLDYRTSLAQNYMHGGSECHNKQFDEFARYFGLTSSQIWKYDKSDRIWKLFYKRDNRILFHSPYFQNAESLYKYNDQIKKDLGICVT